MKTKIILLDIDGTLFNPLSFIEDFYQTVSQVFNLSDQDIDEIKKIYEQTKEEYDYFYPPYFESEITKKIPKIQGDKLHGILWDVDLFEKNVYKDASVVNDLSKTAIIGIFSKGDSKFQKQKIKFIKKLADENIHIFKDKTKNLKPVSENYKEFEVYLIDNEIEVLKVAKNIRSNLFAILIDRAGLEEVEKSIIKIKGLEELKGII